MKRRPPPIKHWQRPPLPEGFTFHQLNPQLDDSSHGLDVDERHIDIMLAACNTTFRKERDAGRIWEILVGWYRDGLARGEKPSHVMEFLLSTRRLMIDSPDSFRAQASLRIH